ncbi:MAG TPA: hypothetical protein PKM65_12795 [Spirochaetota bacterium]|nr:hypothetical protein [Spirochaetota bacterium]HNT10941.1 hypothetical protein [Spirochaetota bacterium]
MSCRRTEGSCVAARAGTLRAMCLAALVALTISCSTMSAAWYSQPEPRYRSRAHGGMAALVEAGGVRHVILSLSNRYKVYMGPPLVPVRDMEPPILNEQTFELRWQIRPPGPVAPGTSTGWRLVREALAIRSNDGTVITPTHISIEGLDYGIGETLYVHYAYEEVPAVVPVARPVEVTLRFYNLSYGRMPKRYSFEPALHTGDERIAAPRVQFVLKRDYEYKPCVVPLYFMSVR